jgi:hypothetical protein
MMELDVGFLGADDRDVRDDLPSGTDTFLFTDEGSTSHLHEIGPEDYAAAPPAETASPPASPTRETIRA